MMDALKNSKSVVSYTQSASIRRTVASAVIARWRDGESVDAAVVLREHPELRDVESIVLDLAYEEYCIRTERGEDLAPSQFCRGFGDHQDALLRQIELHHLIEERPDLIGKSEWPESDSEFLGYSLVSEIGRGTFSRVFEAREIAIGHRPVVLKVARDSTNEAHTLGPTASPKYRSDPFGKAR